MKKSHIPIDIGTQFGEWTVIEGPLRDRILIHYKCRCSCGSEALVMSKSLRQGRSKQCKTCAVKTIKKHETNEKS